jgi:hypothetical protein
MSDKQKLQCLFEAALKDPSLPSGGMPRRAYPVPVFDAMPVPRVEATPVRAVHPARPMPCVPVAALPPESAWQGNAQPTMGKVLDHAASSELASLMQNQNRWEHRKFRVNLLFSATVLSALAAVGSVWWLQAGQQHPTSAETTREVRPADGSGLTTGGIAETNAPVSNEAAALESGLSSTR